MDDTSKKPPVPKPGRPQEFDDPHFHDDDEVDPSADADEGRRPPPRKKPSRYPPPRRRYPED